MNKVKFFNNLFARKIIISIIFLGFLGYETIAQNDEVFHIISTTGKIMDKRSGHELQVGDEVSFQTELAFGSLHDRAVLLSSEKAKYFLELPKSSFVNSQLTVSSDKALSPVKSRPALSYDTRGPSVLMTNGLSSKTLKEYFSIDTFTVIGAKFTLPVKKQDLKKYALVLKYEIDNNPEEFVVNDFSISKNDLKIEGDRISECFVLLKDGEQTLSVTKLALIFVEKATLFSEFDSLLKALKQNKAEKNEASEILRQYCTDVYGLIDRSTLETTIIEYLTL
jgi:hypothetical protein